MRRHVVLACLALSATLGWFCWSLLRAPATVERRESGPDVVERIGQLSRGDPGWIRRFPDSRLARFPLPERLASAVFQWNPEFERYDPHTYFAHRPNLEQRRELPEHPRGAWTLRTNSLGLRRDGEVAATRPDLRVLVVGDSHSEGVCENSETLSALAEGELRALDPQRSVEVLNAARGGFGPLNYVGAVEKFEYLAPHVVVVVFSESNDFADSLALAHGFAGTLPEPFSARATAQLRKARRANGAACGSGLAGAHYFRERPSDVDLAVDLALEACAEIDRVCAASGARSLFAFLPAPCFLEWEAEPPGMELVRNELALTAEDVARYRGLGDRFVQGLASAGREVLDLRPLLASPAEDWFWQSNYHLSPSGHARVASALVERLAESVPR